ncbi:MAG: hypothetical protein PVF83_13185 [Anaerolineales bacterium]|jgi:hypothetical protein
MFKVIQKYQILFVFVLLISGCGNKYPNVSIKNHNVLCYDSPGEIEISKLNILFQANEEVSLSLLEDYDYRINEPFSLLIQNKSEKDIYIPTGYVQHIVRITESENPIRSFGDRYLDSDEPIILSPYGTEGSLHILQFQPIMLMSNKPELFYLSVMGFEYSNGKICNNLAVAELEFYLYP